jgi:hypothetical protein
LRAGKRRSEQKQGKVWAHGPPGTQHSEIRDSIKNSGGSEDVFAAT